MAKYEIYVITTEIYRSVNKLKTLSALSELKQLKKDLSAKYGGLTRVRIHSCEGIWLNENKQLEFDKVEIWRILTDKIVLPSEVIDLGEKFAEVCEQKEQLITVNDNPYFIKRKEKTI